MEELMGPEVEVILTLKEVTDLSFITTPVFAIATLFDNQMETDVYEPETIIKFNTDLVWESNKSNIKRMRNNNIPIKLNLYKYMGRNQKEKFGYVILNLRTAQYIPRGKITQITEDYVKILGLGKEAKGSCPQLLMSLRIQDKMPDRLYTQSTSGFKSSSAKESGVFGHGSHETLNDKEILNEVHDILNDSLPLQETGEPKMITVDEEPLPRCQSKTNSPRMKHSLQPDIQDRICLSSFDKQLSCGDQLNKRYIQAYHNFKLEIRLENILWLKIPPKFRFRFHQSRSEILSTAHPEIQIDKVDEIIQLCDIKAVFSFVETPAEFYKLINMVPPVVSISCNLQNRPVVVARGDLETNKLSFEGGETIHKIALIDTKNHETVGKLTYAATLCDCGPQVMKDVTLKLRSTAEVNENDLPPVMLETVTDKIVDELEDWKERQKQIFQQEFSSKLQKEMSELRSDWMERRKELERKVNERMEQCRQLGNSLVEATEDVKQKNLEFLEKEKQLEITKHEMESRYLKMLKEKTDEIDKMKLDFSTRLEISNSALAEMQKKQADSENIIRTMKMENDKLRESLKHHEYEIEKKNKASLSQEQTATLLQDLKNMQEKLETANNSKMFFKEQWGRAVREIHRIKSEYTKNIQVQLQYRKDELKKLGLDQLFLNEKNRSTSDRDETADSKEFVNMDFDVRNSMSDMDFPYKTRSDYESFRTNMDIIKANNSYMLKFNQESEEKLKKLIEERDKLLCEGVCQIDDENIIRLNKEIRHLLEH